MLRRYLNDENSKYHTRVRMALPSLIYMTVYLIWWGILERVPRTSATVIYMQADDYIPFLEIFVVPYMIWFAYVIGTVGTFLWKEDKHDYYRLIVFLYTGMTLFLIISTVSPNIHFLRPNVMPRDNVFTRLIRHLYLVDTPTNLWPSIHVYNAVGSHIAIAKSERFGENRVVRGTSFVVCTLIILSTMFIKQHSVFDVMTGLMLSGLMGALVYRLDVLIWGKRNGRALQRLRY